MRPSFSLVPGCSGCTLAITGLRAAIAEAKSLPAIALNANGKLFGPNTVTGLPSGPNAARSPVAVSTTGCAQLHSRTARAAWRSWPVVRGSSTSRRRGEAGSPVSACASATSASASASIPAA
jgi:hypothetical protein